MSQKNGSSDDDQYKYWPQEQEERRTRLDYVEVVERRPAKRADEEVADDDQRNEDHPNNVHDIPL